MSSEQMRAEIAQRWRLPAAQQVDWVDIFAERTLLPAGGRKLAVRTDKPFHVLGWFRQEERAHHYIRIRVIDAAPGESLVEVWDYQFAD